MKQIAQLLVPIRVFATYLIIVAIMLTVYALINSIVVADLSEFTRILLRPSVIAGQLSVAIFLTIFDMYIRVKKQRIKRRIDKEVKMTLEEFSQGHDRQLSRIKDRLKENNPASVFQFQEVTQKANNPFGSVICYQLHVDYRPTIIKLSSLVIATTKDDRRLEDIVKTIEHGLLHGDIFEKQPHQTKKDEE